MNHPIKHILLFNFILFVFLQPPWCRSMSLRLHWMRQKPPSPSCWSLPSHGEHLSGTSFLILYLFSLSCFVYVSMFLLHSLILLSVLFPPILLTHLPPFLSSLSIHFPLLSSSRVSFKAIKVTRTYKSNLYAKNQEKGFLNKFVSEMYCH